MNSLAPLPVLLAQANEVNGYAKPCWSILCFLSDSSIFLPVHNIEPASAGMLIIAVLSTTGRDYS